MTHFLVTVERREQEQSQEVKSVTTMPDFKGKQLPPSRKSETLFETTVKKIFHFLNNDVSTRAIHALTDSDV